MKRQYTSAGISFRIWLLTNLVLASGTGSFFMLTDAYMRPGTAVLIFFCGLVASIPALTVLFIALPLINTSNKNWKRKLFLLVLVLLGITLGYGFIFGLFSAPVRLWNDSSLRFTSESLLATAAMFGSAVLACLFLLKILASFFSRYSMDLSYYALLNSLFYFKSKYTTMETTDQEQQVELHSQSRPNGLFIKGAVTGVLILLMLVPTMFINNIIKEREQRQKDVVAEVSSKWSKAQTVAAPYLVLPYTDTAVDSDGKTIAIKTQLILLANDLDVKALILPEQRPRSIYKVLLYKTDVHLSGLFKPDWPADINPAAIDFANAKLCFGISDFKGIEEEIVINLNNKFLPISPGLPLNDLHKIGLSVPVSLTTDVVNAGIPFSMHIRLKGSEQFHFLPLSAKSKISIASPWTNPSFDGNILPNERKIDDKGFMARWNFNRANLPFGTVLKQGMISDTSGLAFGVTMVQPADQYDKSMRSVKYAILFIGLTFALFFIIEIMQHRPFHPVQYVLVGLALVIFYSLLLSISEYILFNQAYLIAALATVVLISLYAKSHFASWKTSAIFFTTLGLLYGFIFILISLEDTALLVGSIGLFIVLALVMYASRKVRWYGRTSYEL